jgi:hypothetical protein
MRTQIPILLLSALPLLGNAQPVPDPKTGRAGNTTYTEYQSQFADQTPEPYKTPSPIPPQQIPPIELPFGMEWGENQDNLKNWVATNQFSHIEGTDSFNRHVWEISGPFPNTEFSRLRFVFDNNQLVECELQFLQKPEMELEDVISQAISIKTALIQKYGAGKILPPKEGNTPNSNWKCIQQVWTDEEHSILLNYYQSNPLIQNANPLVITSLHYRWEVRFPTQNHKQNTASKKSLPAIATSKPKTK